MTPEELADLMEQGSPNPPGAAAPSPFEFIALNGFMYRGNKATGEMWRLEMHPTEKKR